MITDLHNLFQENSDSQNATDMSNYMKNNFDFYGIKSQKRKELFFKIFKSQPKFSKTECNAILEQMFQHPKREMQYCALDLMDKYYKKDLEITDIIMIKKLIQTKSWWDSVDFLASTILGRYAQQFPTQIPVFIDDFMASNDMWLQRSCLIFQLKFKEKVDKELLFTLCDDLKDSKEFFIQKAIGWALRQYAKFNPKDVYTFVENTHLKPLSKREATKYLK